MIAPPSSALAAELWLVVQPAAGDPDEVAVEARAGATVEDLTTALAAHVAYDSARPGLFCERLQAWVPPELPIAAAGLRSGDTVVVGDAGVTTNWSPQASRHLRADLSELIVVGGPRSGERIGLAKGLHSVGREADVAIDDPSLSREHFRLDVDRDRIAVTDLGSKNGTAVEGVLLEPGVPRELLAGEVVEAGRSLMTCVSVLAPGDAGGTATFVADGRGRVPFNRPPRVLVPQRQAVFPLEPPPDIAQKMRLPLVGALIPVLVGGLAAYVMGQPKMLLMLALSPVMALASFAESRRSGKGNFRTRSEDFQKALATVEMQVEAALAAERDRRREAAPAAPELVDRATRYRPSLWERRPADEDFLRLRVGTGRMPSETRVEMAARGSADLLAATAARLARFETVSPVPVTLDLPALGGVGLTGRRDRVDALGRWLALQVGVLQSPRDVVIAAAVHQDSAPAWSWLKWLPHTHSETSPIAARQLAVGPADSATLLQSIADVAKARRADRAPTIGRRETPLPYIVLVVDERVDPSRSILTDILTGGPDAGIGVVWLGGRTRDVPGECVAIVEGDAERATAVVTDARTGERIDDVTADGVDIAVARTCAMALAPVRDTSAGKGRGSIPRRVLLPELLRLTATAEGLAEAWAAGEGHRSATVGATADGALRVDLREDGPHALVAGTTGAGKSELLQTFVAALAAEHPPTRVTFLLIDYKGGAAFKECVALPHVVGLVTDLDEHLTQRALQSLNAELRRREEILRDAGAKDLLDMERRDPDHAPASLVIIVDEFATLAKEVPDFVAGVVDVAQRGRSLGVHLVLATQRPGGVVSENIRANTNLRIALRVNNPAESSDVIGADVAAKIARDTPGRAFARLGHGDLTEFQAAYVGGVSQTDEGGVPVLVRTLAFDARTATQERLAADAAPNVDSDLARIVKSAAAATETLRLPIPPTPWLPPLPDAIVLDSLPSSAGPTAVVGLVDEPSHQRQTPYALDLARDGSLLVYGASGAGKTTFLRTAAVALASAADPADLWVYGLDFGSRALQMLETLPHVGSVVAGEDEERVTRLFGLLRRELAGRKERFARLGVFDIDELRRMHPAERVPRIVVLIDNYAGFVSAYERVNMGELVELVPRLVGDGRPLGIHFLITGDRRGAIPSTVAGVTPRKIVFRMADQDDYSALGLDPRATRGARLPAGRAFVDGALEMQAAVVGGVATNEQAATIAAAAEPANGPGGPPAVGSLPTSVDRTTLPHPAAFQAYVGIGDAALAPVAVDLAPGHLLVVGPYRSGRSTALATLAGSLAQAGTELLALCPRRSPLLDLGVWAALGAGAEECEALVRDLVEQLDARDESSPPVVLFVDDGEQLAEGATAQQLETLIRRGRDLGVRVVAGGETQAVVRAFGGWLREIRKDEQGILLDPTPETDGDLLGVRLPRRPTWFAPGRGYLVVRGQVELVQVAA